MYFLVVQVLGVWTNIVIHTPQDLGVEGVDTELPFVSSVLWEGDEDDEPL